MAPRHREQRRFGAILLHPPRRTVPKPDGTVDVYERKSVPSGKQQRGG
jgi:hypothetical protein